MRRVIMGAAIALGAMVIVPATVTAQRDTIRPGERDSRLRIEQLMTADERRAAGVEQLAPAQRVALERWLERYTATVAEVSREQAERRDMERQRRPARPGASPPETPRPIMVVSGDPHVRTFRLESVTHGGSYVVLSDGTRWQVDIEDIVRTASWRAGAPILLRVRPIARGTYDMLLINGEDGTRAGARLGAPPAGHPTEGQ